MTDTLRDFECHITIQASADEVEPLEKLIDTFPEWSFSRIAGDPVLGRSTFCYATAHFSRKELAMFQTVTMAALLESMFTVVRRKIEEVVWDSRKHQGVWS